MVASPIKTTKLSFGVSHQLKPLAMGSERKCVMVASPIKTTKLSFGVSHQLKPLVIERNCYGCLTN
jgi:hypothetical protein